MTCVLDNTMSSKDMMLAISPDMNQYKCDRCDFVSNEHRVLLQHRIHGHADLIVIFSCDCCPYVTDQVEHFEQHQMYRHSGVAPWRGSNLSIDHEDELEDAVLATRVLNVEAEGQVHKCVVEQNEEVGVEIDPNKNSKRTKCGGNRKRCRSIGNFKYQCSDCLFGSLCIAALNKHRLNHTIVSRFKCDVCSYSSKLIRKVDAHQCRYHLATTKVKDPNTKVLSLPDESACDNAVLCNTLASARIEETQLSTTDVIDVVETKSFMRDRSEKSVDFKYQCSECLFGSVAFSKLNKHRLNHTILSRYKCDVCSYSSEVIIKVEAHQRKYHVVTNVTDDEHTKVLHVRHESACIDTMLDNASSVPGVEETQLSTDVVNEVIDDLQTPVGGIHCRHSEDGLFHCHECAYSSAHEANFRRHCAHHLLNGPAKCPFCTFSASSGARIVVHVTSYHPEDDTEAGRGESELQKVCTFEEGSEVRFPG